MKTLIQLATIGAVALAAAAMTSCGCCTGEAKAPPLRPLPHFKEIPVHYGK